MTADSATLKLDNQKNGWKGVCIHQESTGDKLLCPVRALGQHYLHILSNQPVFEATTPLSTYYMDGIQYDITDKEVSTALKFAASVLEYPSCKGIPIERIDMHSLHIGGANALLLSG